MPSLIITVNKTTEIRMNLPCSTSRGVDIAWIGGIDDSEDGFFCFHIGGVDGDDRISWETPDLSVGDEITIKISKDSVVDSATTRKHHEKIERGKSNT